MASISYMPGEAIFARPLPAWKRAIDVAGSLFGIIVLSPLFLIMAAYIKIVSPGPVFFKQKRVGYCGKEFTIWKFRTMRMEAESAIHENYATSLIKSDARLTKLDTYQDPRIIPLGNILRQTGVDELPQLLNVLRGDMSLVGPRPDPLYSAREYRSWHRARLDVVPGMTGLWQVSGKNRTTFSQMIRLDITYARSQSFWLDGRILTLTPSAILQQVKDGFVRQKSRIPHAVPGFSTLARCAADPPQQTHASHVRFEDFFSAADRRDPAPPRNRAMLQQGEETWLE